MANVPFISSSQAGITARIQTPNIAFPLKISPNARYFVDQINRPVFLLGDSAWALLANASPSDRLLYLQTRAGQGFNAILIAPFADKYIWGNANGTCQSFEGQIPFTPTPTLTSAILTSRVETYWQLVDTVIDQANNLSMAVILAVAETAPAGSGGWNTIWNNTSVADAQNYGSFLGNRYKNKLNVMWLLGNDYQNWPGIDSVLTAFAGAIRAAAPNQLMSWELDYQLSVSSNDPGLSSYLDFNWAYTYFPTYQEVYRGYQASPTRPVVLGEAVYEQETIYGTSVVPVSTQVLRLQAMWLLTSGACGHFYGSIFTDKFTAANWQTSMTQPGSTQLINLINLIKNYNWWLLAPDIAPSHSLITSGYGILFTTPGDQTTSSQQSSGAANTVIHADGTPDNYSTGAIASDGSVAFCAIPAGGTVTVDLTRFSGPVTARWYDATNDAFTAIGSGLTGSQTFTAPTGAAPPPSPTITYPAATYFVTQAGTGNGSGTDVNNTASMASFNAKNFGTVPAAGLTVQFLGTITSQIVPISGGNPATGAYLYLDMRNATLNRAGAAISCHTKSYIMFLGGWLTSPVASAQLIEFGTASQRFQSDHITLDGWNYNGGVNNATTGPGAFIDIHFCSNLTISDCHIDWIGGPGINCDDGGIGTNYNSPGLNHHILITGCYIATNLNTGQDSDCIELADFAFVTIEKNKLITRSPGHGTSPANHNDCLQTYIWGADAANPAGRGVNPYGWVVRYNWLENDEVTSTSSGDISVSMIQFMQDGADGTPAMKYYANIITKGPGANAGSYNHWFDKPENQRPGTWTIYHYNNTYFTFDTSNQNRAINETGSTNTLRLFARNNLSSGINKGSNNSWSWGGDNNPGWPNVGWDYNFVWNGTQRNTELGANGSVNIIDPLFANPVLGLGADYSCTGLLGKADPTIGAEYAFGIAVGSTWPNPPGTQAAPATKTAPPTIVARGTAWDPGAYVSGSSVGGGSTGGNSAGQPDFMLVLTLTTSPAIRPHLTAAASSGTTIGTRRILRPLLTLRQIN